MNTLKEHDDLYLKADILLRPCVLEEFTKELINSLKLDPGHYLLESYSLFSNVIILLLQFKTNLRY